MKTSHPLFWALRIIAAGLMLQTLYFKFTANPESVYIFTTLGIEPWGRILSGVMELIASILLLRTATVFIGACITAGVMAGAIASHLFILGIEVRDDGGLLFLYACIVMISAVILLVGFRHQLFEMKQKFFLAGRNH